jgi:hypothetical protein
MPEMASEEEQGSVDEETLENRIALIEDELELLKTNVLPALLEIRERILARDKEV